MFQTRLMLELGARISASNKTMSLLARSSSNNNSVLLCRPSKLTKSAYSSDSAAKPALSQIAARQAKIAEDEAEKARRVRAAELAKLAKPAKAQLPLAKLVAPYVDLMRLDRLAPVHLAYWPSAWAILGAASYIQADSADFFLLGLFAAGALTMRTAGCIVNDMWDRRIDGNVERTKDRPLVSGRVSMPAATALLAANLAVSLSLLLQLNLATQVLGACALFPTAVYPAAKRFTHWPQAVLGVVYNWGALMGWSAVMFSTASQAQSILTFLPVLPLYVACINWTLFYDTIYALQDKESDKLHGINSTAITLEKRTTLWLLGFSTMCTSNLALFGWLTSQEPVFYITVGLAMAHFVKQLALVDYKSPESCSKQFRSNRTIGFLVAFGLLASIYIK